MIKKRLYAKCILAGEHSVLRGYPAIAVPCQEYFLDFEYTKTETSLQVSREGVDLEALDAALALLFLQTVKSCQKESENLQGKLKIHNQIPFGWGLGASAVLSLMLAYIARELAWIDKDSLASFASNLENLFHGKSSGLDVASILTGEPILYEKSQIKKKLGPSLGSYNFYLSYSGNTSSTDVCIRKVEDIYITKNVLAKELDKKMTLSVSLFLQALYEENSEAKLVEALDEGLLCFKEWGLLSLQLSKHMDKLREKGALCA